MTLPLFEPLFAGTPAPPKRKLMGADLKKSGMDSVMKHTPRWYVDAFRNTVEGFHKGKTFTVEDVRAAVGDPPPEAHYNAMGSLMRMIGASKLAKKTGYNVKAQRPHMNNTEIALWIRL